MAGSIIGLVVLGVMIGLSRDADRSAWAVEQVNRQGLALEQLHARGDFWDSVVLAAAVGIVFLVATAMAGAGVSASFGNGPLAIVLLVASEVLVVASELVLLGLGFMKWRRRDKAFGSVRLTRKEERD